MKNDEGAPTQRKVYQPTNGGPRTYLRLLPGAPTFQKFVDDADKVSHDKGKKPLPIDFLRDEYFSCWGTN